MSSPQTHAPVLLREVITGLKIIPSGVYVDGTFGRGGYTRQMLESAACQVIALDCDAAAIAAGMPLAKASSGRLQLVHSNYAELTQVVSTQVQGVVFDLGVSSPQLDDASRGFSFRADGPLDMRMDQRATTTAATIVNTASAEELADIIFNFGEEKFARKITQAIVSARATTPFQTTLALANLIAKIVPHHAGQIHPATRTFQALRIAVNQELSMLANGLAAAEKILAPQGRLVVVSFHSLEDRIVKQFLSLRSKKPATSRYQPTNDNWPAPSFQLITRQPITADANELAQNPRARSAKLRIAERTTAPVFVPPAAEQSQ